MMSDIIVVLLMPIITLNILIILMVFINNILENIFNKYQLSKLLKGFTLYIAISLPVIVAYACYRFFYLKKIEIISNDVSEAYYINDKTIANSTDVGNNTVFICILLGWIIGIIIFGLFRLLNEKVFIKRLEKLSRLVNDAKSIEIKNKLIKELGIKKDVRIFTNPIIPSPFIIGFMHPKMFISENEFSELQLEFILRHELTHLAMNDYIYRKIMFFICILYWFNPVSYIFSNKFIEINEMACDERVLRGYKNREKVIYMTLLCNMASNERNMNSIIYFKGKVEKSFERRLKNMMNPKKAIKTLPFALAATFILGLCPVASYAVTGVVIDTQSNIAEALAMNGETKEIDMDKCIEYKEIYKVDSVEIMQEILPVTGIVNLEVNLKGKSRFVTNRVTLGKNSEVDISLNSDNSNDEFKAGLIDNNNKKIYVESNKGQIFHKFKIKEAGEYRLFIEGLNKGENIHVTGYAYIKN